MSISTNKAFTLLLAVVFAIGLMFFVVMPSVSFFRKPTPTLRCASNLKRIATAMLMYVDNNKGHIPDDLSKLFTYCPLHSLFVCPRTGHRPGTIDNVEQWTDYTLLSNHDINNPFSSPLAYCPPENHSGQARVAFWDGHVGLLGSDEFHELLRLNGLKHIPKEP